MPIVALLNSNDPWFEFEHMMAHRQYFSIMGNHQAEGNLAQFSVLPYLLDPSNNDTVPGGDWNNRHQTSHNDFNTDLPSNYSDGFTSETITPPLITAIGNSLTPLTSLQLTSVTPPEIIIGSGIIGFGVTITGQTSGTPGGDGVYTINPALDVSGAAMTIGHPPYQQVTVIDNAGTIGMHQPGILLEGKGNTPEQQSWWTFVNHQQHYEANRAILPLPTTSAMTVETGPSGETISASNPWWWTVKGPVIYPFW